jgi:hypothetical protein
MPSPPAATLIDAVLGLVLGSAGQEAGNRFSIEGLTFSPGKDGAHELAIRKLEATALRLASGPHVLEVGQLVLGQLVAQVRIEGGKPRLSALEAASAEISGLKIDGPIAGDDTARLAAGAWSLGPLTTADGTIHAKIVDAHLLFDADVTVPIRQGQVHFKDTSVEHVGPDSRLGVSRLGLYVDAPNGRSYLYQFASAPVLGVEYEKRGAFLGPWVTDRGSLQLQPFGEGLLRGIGGREAPRFTAQARLLFERTAVMNAGAAQLGCDELTGNLSLRLTVDGARVRFALHPANMKLSGLRLHLSAPQGA